MKEILNYYDEGLKVLLADGTFKAIKDLNVGDKVINGNGEIDVVCGINKKYSNELYLIESTKKDRTSIIVDKECILACVDTQGHKKDISVEKYLKKNKSEQAKYKLHMSDSIDKFTNNKPLRENNGKILSILVNDSTLMGSIRVSPKKSLKPIFETWAATNGIGLRTGRYNGYYLFNNIHKTSANQAIYIIENLDINHKKVIDRPIPKAIKFSSLKTRKEFVDATIEACGTKNGPGFTINKRNRQYALDLAFMAQSIGYSSYVRYGNKDGKKYYTVNISFNSKNTPVLINKKIKTSTNNPCLIRFKVEKAQEGYVCGVALEKSHSLITEDFTVINVDTANTLKSAVSTMNNYIYGGNRVGL